MSSIDTILSQLDKITPKGGYNSFNYNRWGEGNHNLQVSTSFEGTKFEISANAKDLGEAVAELERKLEPRLRMAQELISLDRALEHQPSAESERSRDGYANPDEEIPVPF